MDWSYFDDIVCISCTNATERRKRCDLIFKEFNIPCRYHIVERHPGGINPGCFESHIQLLTQCQCTNKKNILIFEDDLVVSPFLNATSLQQCVTFMKENPWDIFFLGAVPDPRKWYRQKRLDGPFYEIKGICTHAYVANETVIKAYANKKYEHVPIDYLYRDDTSLRCIANYPTLFYQETGAIKYVPQHMVNKYMRTLEWYCYYINLPQFTLYIIILIILLLILYKWIRT